MTLIRTAITKAEEPVTKPMVYAALQNEAEEIRKADKSLTPEQAFDLAYRQNPDLVAEFREAPDPERVERADPEPEPLVGGVWVAKLDHAAEQIRKSDSTLTPGQAFDRAYQQNPHLVRAYRFANGWL